MRLSSLIIAGLVAAVPAVALADDPNDPKMRTAEARARDREMTRQLNLEQLAKVRQRDARSAQAPRTARSGKSHAADEAYSVRVRNYERAMSRHTQDRAQYEREMAEWRRAVAACRAGDYSACD